MQLSSPNHRQMISAMTGSSNDTPVERILFASCSLTSSGTYLSRYSLNDIPSSSLCCLVRWYKSLYLISGDLIKVSLRLSPKSPINSRHFFFRSCQYPFRVSRIENGGTTNRSFSEEFAGELLVPPLSFPFSHSLFCHTSRPQSTRSSSSHSFARASNPSLRTRRYL